VKLGTLFEKFDLIADAPDAVAKMRELVLELSATGRLLPEALERAVEEDTKLMGSIVELVMGQAPAGDEYNTEGRGTVFVKVGEFGALYPREEVWTTNPLKFAKIGDVLVCVVGATIGKLNLGIDCAIGRSVAAIRPSPVLDTKFLYYSLTPYTLRLRRNSRGSAQGVIGKAELNAVSLWVPSREVQERIVEKVDELMALCDRLELQQQERETRHAELAGASLLRFADAPTPANLDLLFHKSYSIPPADLRKAILALAVQGKLVPQDPNDEPTGELVEKIRGEKLRSARLGKVGKTGDFAPIADTAKPFDIPRSWNWVPLGNVSFIRTGKLDANASSPDGQYPFFTCAKDPLRIDRYAYDGECVLLAGNGNFDVNYYYGKFEAYQRTYIIEGVSREIVDGRYLFRFLQKYADTLREMSVGGVISYIKIGFLTGAPFPLPPLAEQRRIVARVDHLMALIDQLETQLDVSRATGAKLTDALVTDVCARA
jgi:type I restriction enzyme S subunit